ncbi:low specificity L-threonine aldolase [Staphylococcus pasteuri]|uniref:threonine aldolase family protein n=1 Tax=Staphylococcus pasteuri TaxID=45972 RepID=UPI00086DFE00|nr:low specificity L-threonine aldolase [Staphylococcus pasteuri]ODB57643.1 threonine aldolase [Staphylococcus sp. AOAB]RQX28673.1 low specificity L-threonine aldolase [Staphylococcus warneri]MCO0860536.1 low specificity L-threonine aldolase [Staphylococcus pasteuri]MCO5359303.1 low specificity L-threonine aldolase [Staphylococcus pasteuri]PTU82538.1 low specificity L-threonine aldolase [Staphylococcus pasteuri]
MLSFENDYLEGAHEKVLNRLVETNRVQAAGYGFDHFTEQAIQQIKNRINCPKATVRFLVGGTQTNQVVINSVLESYEGVISADTGHVAVHEGGAIEYSGHKVLAIPSSEGKITAKGVEDYLDTFNSDFKRDHMVFPGMVYISHPTEYGTLYTKPELESLSKVCQKHNLPLFMDGARLGYGLMSDQSDLTIEDVAKYCDIFYIGGTKIGALCGEAIVFTKQNEPKQFTTRIKHHGALLAKGRLTGIQFLELFNDDLYFKISRHAIEMANKMKAGFLEKGYQLYFDSPTNQQFFILSNEKISELEQKVKFAIWEKYDDQHRVVRFATSWATTEENVDQLLALI